MENINFKNVNIYFIQRVDEIQLFWKIRLILTAIFLGQSIPNPQSSDGLIDCLDSALGG